MKLTKTVLGLSLAAVVGLAPSLRADDTPVKGKKSLESRIAELEAKLKDAGAGGVKGSGIKVSGYVDTSYLVNLADRDNNAGAAPASGASVQNTGRAFDRQFNSFNLNAVKLTIEKDKDTSKFPAGFRVDTIYGEDANVISGAGGLGDSTLQIEQAYITLGAPIGNGIDIKVGKMVTLLGYEVIESPANWQFSRSDAFRLSPLTQNGVTLGYKWNDYLTSTVGIINGIDSGTDGTLAPTGAGNRNTDFSFVGRLDVAGPKTSLGEFNAFVAAICGNDAATPATRTGTAAAAASGLNGVGSYIWNIGGTWNKPFDIKALGLGVDYLYRNDTVNTAAFAAGSPTPNATIDASALSFYGKWDWNKWLTTSGRLSYSVYKNANQRNNAGAIVAGESLGAFAVPTTLAAGGFLPQTTDTFSYTLTQAFNVWKDTLVRLEWRHDWTTTGAVGFGAAGAGAGTQRDDIRQEQDTIAVNVVYSF